MRAFGCPYEIEDYMRCMTNASDESWNCDGTFLRLNPGVCDAEGRLRNACLACGYNPDDGVEATLTISGDDEYKLWVDGELIDDVPHTWSEPQTYTVYLYLDPRQPNVIAVEATNRYAGGTGLDRAVAVGLTVHTPSGDARLVSDSAWRTSATTPDTSWIGTSFDDSSWQAAVALANIGDPPWYLASGEGLAPDAKWIWSYVPIGDNKPTEETIYLRRTFYVGANSQILDAPAECP
jgi:hypothetical protein